MKQSFRSSAEHGETDKEMTKLILKSIADWSGLSKYALNIGISTVRARVTLNGPVETLYEKKVISPIAD